MSHTITPEEFSDLLAWIRARWQTRQWPNDGELYPDFSNLRLRSVRLALKEYYDAGHDKAPKPASIRARAIELERSSPPNGIDPDVWCNHRWAIVDESAGYRTGQCVRCGQETTRLAEHFPTPGELAATERARLVAQRSDPIPTEEPY